MNLHKKLLFDLNMPLEISDEKKLIPLVSEVKKHISRNSVLLLSGEMAAGKTTFTRYFCESFHLKNIQSPTYAIHQVYENDQIKINHFDLYRLDSEAEIESSGFWDIFQNKNDFFMIEWPEKLGSSDWLRDRDAYQIQIDLFANLRRYQFFKLEN